GGMKVALLEMREICSGASGRMGGQVLELEPATSEAAAGGKYTLSNEIIKKKNIMARNGKSLLDSLSDELGIDIEYVKNGSVVIAYSKEEANEIKKGIEHQNEAEKTDIIFLSPSQTSKLYPVFSDNYGARYSETDGNANPFRIAYGFAYAAQKIGLKIFTYTPVKSLVFKKYKVTGVKTNRGEFYARFGVVMATSAWNKNILPEYPILPWKHLGFVTEQLPILPVPATDIYYGIKNGKIVDSYSQKKGITPFRVFGGSQKDGSIIIGGDPVGLLKMEDHLTEDVHLEDFLRYGAVFNKFWVNAKDASLLRVWAGSLPFTPDGMPFVGPTRFENLYMNSGNVNGNVFCPITGKTIAEYILNNGKTSISIDFLNPERFEGDEFEWPEKYDYNTLADYISKK
ncbi:NAD(P)/FAD-dependent oxidoreductase, partial [Actinomycetota bacterium]